MTEEDIIAYLLEELSETDRERFEEECFALESWPPQINLVEEELIDHYLRAELAPERRVRFEENYLTTDARHERVSIAAALLRHVDDYNASPAPVPVVSPGKPALAERLQAFWRTWTLRAATAVALVAIGAGSLWLFRTPPAPVFSTLTLTISNSNRAEGVQPGTVKLAPNAAGLNVSLVLPQPEPPAARYRVELENDNAEARSVEVVGKDTQSVIVVIPAAQLTRGQYALKLFAIKPDGAEQRINGIYFFVVE
jgi:hypothetical protein